MNNNKSVTLVVWLLCFALTIALLLLIPSQISSPIYAVLVFDIIAFVSQLVLWLIGFGNKAEVFYKYPSIIVSVGYLIIQFVLSLITAFEADVISMKIVLIVNIILLVFAWIILCVSMSSVPHTQKVDSRQINHHTKLQ